jgi:L-alanine-DL-glutamate epimerase-like enolase superfamily enzyme
MRIERVEVFHVEIPFRVPFVVWRGELPGKEHVLVRVTTDDGLQGWGEAAPFLYYSPETAMDIAWFIEHVLTAEVIGRDPRDVRAIYDSFGMLDGHHFAKGAIECALWDILAQAAALPLYRLLGGPVREAVPLTTVLHVDEPAHMAEEALRLVERGFHSLKMKIGFGAERDVAMISAVREAVGNEVKIRVDAEEHYTVKEALAICRQLEWFNLELISQPVARTDWEGMARLRDAVPMPLLADEGIHAPHDVLTCIDHGSADMVNIKVLKCGGLIPSVEMAAICAAAHLPVMLGSMIEAGIGTLFSAHVAMALPGVFSTELCGPLLLADDLLEEPVVVRDGAIHLSDRPGLGTRIDADRLACLTRS